MRISDWSSDVCSSDLDWSRGDREVCRSSVYLLIWESRPKPGCRDKSSRLGAVRFLALIRIEIALTQTDRLRCDLDHFVIIDVGDGLFQRHALGRRQTDGVILAARPEVGELRSEEHTSELQSLMRISYAVFCLKKKKKQN